MTELLRLRVRVRPGARRTAVGGSWAGPGDQPALGPALVVAVAAPAVDGKANEAVCMALAKAVGVRSRNVVIVAGERSRDKTVEIVGDQVLLRARVEELLRATS